MAYKRRKRKHWLTGALVERQLLGACIMDVEQYADVRASVTDADFVDARHVAIWRALDRLFVANQQIDPLTVFHSICGDDNSAAVEVDYVLELSEDVGQTLAVPAWAREVAVTAAARRTMQRLAALEDGAEFATPSEWLEAVAAFAKDGANAPHVSVAVEPIATVVRRLMDQASGAAPAKPAKVGIQWLDALYTAGLANGVHVIGGRPGQGKTALATQMTVAIAEQRRGTAFFACCEMDNDKQGQRFASQQSGIPISAIGDGRLFGDWLRQYQETLAHLHDLPIEMLDGDFTIERICMEATRIAASPDGLAVVVVDYFQRIQTCVKGDRRLDELVSISTQLADLSRRLKVPVIVLAQLNRAVEANSRNPQMSDLSDCSQLEKDAHTILFPMLPHKMGMSSDPSEAVFFMVKDRGGPTGKTEPGDIVWDGKCVRFQS